MHKKKIVLYGGAFNPPHIGHAGIIECILRLFPCDEIWVMPSNDRWDKKISARGEERAEMLECMIKEFFGDATIPVIVSARELARERQTTTYETMRELSSERPDCEFHFFAGSDILSDVKKKWVQGKELWQSAHFVSMSVKNSRLPNRLPAHITLLAADNTTLFSISSTFVRELLSCGHSGLPYISRGVADYIKERSLYQK